MKAVDFKKYDEEKSELYFVIRGLEDNIKELKEGGPMKSPRKPNENAQKFKSFLKEIKGEKEEISEEKEEIVEEGEKPLQKEKDWPLPNQDIIDQLRENNFKIEKEMLNYKYLSSVGEKDYKRVKDKYAIAVNDISFLKDANDKIRIENDTFENRFNSLYSANKESTQYIAVLESENETLNTQVKKLSSILPPNRLALLEKQSPFSIINMQKQKAGYQMNANYLTTQSGFLREATVALGTQTDICGTDQQLIETVKQEVDMEIPMFDREIQCTFSKAETEEKEVETDLTNDEISKMQVKIKELNDHNFNLEKEVSHLNELASERESEFNASLKKIQMLEKNTEKMATQKQALNLEKCEKVSEGSEKSVTVEMNNTGQNSPVEKKDEETELDGIDLFTESKGSMRTSIINKSKRILNKSVDRDMNSKKGLPSIFNNFDNLFQIWLRRSNKTNHSGNTSVNDSNQNMTEKFKLMVKETLVDIVKNERDVNLVSNQDTLTTQYQKQDYDLTNPTPQGSYSPNRRPIIEWMAKQRKPKKRVKTIIKRPVFNIIPYNMRWMDKLMSKVYPHSGNGNTVATQTAENDLDVVPPNEISLNIENNDINPYKCKSGSNNFTANSSPKIKEMRIKRKKSMNKKRKLNKSLKRDIEEFNHPDDLSERMTKSIYDHKKNSAFSSAVFKSDAESKYQTKSQCSRRTKTINHQQYERNMVYKEYLNKKKDSQNQSVYKSKMSNNPSQILDESKEDLLSRNCTTSMQIRDNYKNKGIRKSQVFMKNMHMDYYKSHGNLKSNDNKRKNNNVLKKMKIGGKNIFKPKIIQDNSQSRESGIKTNSIKENPQRISMNLIITKNKKRKSKHTNSSIDNPELKGYKTSDGRTLGDMAEGDFYTNSISYPHENLHGRNMSAHYPGKDIIVQSKSELFDEIDHSRSASHEDEEI